MFSHPDKKHPVVILTRNSVLEYLNQVTIAPITRTIRNIPSKVFLSRYDDGMPKDCAINCDHLQTVSKGKIGSVITELSMQKMAAVYSAVCFALGM